MYASPSDQEPLASATGALNLPARHRPANAPRVPLQRAEPDANIATSAALVWVQAPAGFGKSEWLRRYYQVRQSSGRKAVWINCEFGDSDNELLPLLMHLDGSEQALQLAQQARQSWQPRSGTLGLLGCWTALLQQASDSARKPLEYCLCLDDAHLMDVSGWRLLCELIRLQPAALSLVVASRALPTSATAILMAEDVTHIGIQQLRWSRDDTEHWLQGQQLALDSDDQRLLDQRFHGWPAAIAIWAACLRASGNLATVSVGLANFELQDYWLTDTLASISREERRLLQQAAVLGPVCEGLLSHVNGYACRDLMQSMVRSGFLVAQERVNWAELEPAFVEVAAAAVTERDQEIWHQRAFEWYDKHQQPVQALEHGQRSAIRGGLAVWVETRAEALLASLDIAGLVDWCDRAGEIVLRQSPRLMQLACWAWMLTYRLRRAESLLRHLAQGQQLEPAELKSLQGYMARLKGNSKSASSLCSEALQELPPERYSVRFLMASTLTYQALAETDLDAARACNRTAVSISRQYGSLTLEALALFDQARIELHRGHFPFSKSLVDGGIQRLQSLPEHLSAMPMGRLLLYKAFLQWVTGEDPKHLLTLLEQGISHCCKSGDVLVTYGYGLQAMELAAHGQASKALDCLDDAERLMQRWGVDTEVYLWLMLVKANVWIFQGKYHRAEEGIEQVLGSRHLSHVQRPEIFPMLPDFVAATRARLYLLCGRYDDCLTEVDEWLRCNSSPLIKLLIQMMRAAALRGKNQIAESQHMFNQLGHHMRHEGIGMSFQAWLPELYNSTASSETPASVTVRVQLSDREHDVLRKIAEGASNQEIAAQLFISIHTVKSHARKINMKLGVKNRTQAIRKAKELLLL